MNQLERRDLLTGTWTAFTNLAPAGIGTMLLLTDGSVMAQQAGVTNTWYKLTPGSSGNYASSGTWSTLAPMSTPRLNYASNVLPNGDVFVLGGEFTDAGRVWTNTGEIYDPVSDSWSGIANFPQSTFGDAPSMLLEMGPHSGQILCGYRAGTQTYLYNPATNTWSQTFTKLHNDPSAEETWLRQGNGNVLSYDLWNDVNNGQSTAQIYQPAGSSWYDPQPVPVDLSSAAVGDTLGGATMLPDGRA